MLFLAICSSRAKRPQELKHKTDAQHSSMIMLQQIWSANYDELYREVEDIIIQPGNRMESVNDNGREVTHVHALLQCVFSHR